MWFVPPDVGVQVMVMFVNNDPARGYWFACVPHQMMNHMIPGIAQRGASIADAPDMDPVTEYDKQAIGQYTNPQDILSDPNKTPSHLIQTTILEAQGLAKDEARGPSMSTVRRESPTAVFGISTPGQPTARMAPTPTINPNQYRIVTGRTGGHQFVMDDGDALGQSQCIRIRSSNGGMVLINDTIGSVYVINQSGNAWVEMTANGRIDVYGKGSVDIHSQKDVNITADNNINMLATNNFNLVAANINTEAVEQRHYGKAKFYTRSPDTMMESDSLTLVAKKTAGGGATTSAYGSGLSIQADNGTMQYVNELKTTAGNDITFETKTNFQVKATGVITLNSAGKLELDAKSGIYEASKTGSGTIAALTQDIDTQMQAQDTHGDTKHPTGWTPARNWFDGASTAVPALDKADRTTAVVDIPKPYNSGVQQSHVPVTPQHEPWSDHEINSSSSVPQPATGLAIGAPLFADGSGVAFPDDTTGITSGSIAFALSEPLASFLSDMNITFAAFREDYAATASRGRYQTLPNGDPMVNPNGYIGRYQMGMAILSTLGVTTSSSQSLGSANTASNWTPATKEILAPSFGNTAIFSPPSTPQFGPASVEGFLLDTALQDKAFIAACYTNFLSLKSLGIITGAVTETAADRAGWLKLSLLMGIGNKGSFSKFSSGMKLTAEQARTLTTDANGTGNGAIGLFVHWKVLKQDPSSHASHDPGGGTTYKYFTQGSKTQ